MSRIDTDLIPLTGTPDEQTLARARRRYIQGRDALSEWRKRADEAYDFIAGNQWPEDLANDRGLEGSPCLTVNILRQHALLVANAIRQDRPAQIVGPVDDHGDVQTAEKMQGLVRHIEYESDADTCHDAASWGIVCTGLGYGIVSAQYETPGSFDQKLCIEAVPDPRAIIMDPSSTEPTGRDAEWAFRLRRVSWDALAIKWPKSTTVEARALGASWDELGHGIDGWATPDSCQVADYWCREWHEGYAYRVRVEAGQHPEVQAWLSQARSVVPVLSSGPKDQPTLLDVLTETPFPTIADPYLEGGTLPADGLVVNRRSTRFPIVMHYRMTAHEILERSEWSSNPEADPEGWLPVIRAVGVPMHTQRGLVYDGLVLPGSDGQRFLNFSVSNVAEALGMMPKAPYTAYEGTTDRPEWATANIARHQVLLAKALPENWRPEWGPAPLPQRTNAAPPIEGSVTAMTLAQEIVKQVTGQFSPTKGEEDAGARSGKAIRLLQRQGQTSTFHYGDNLNRYVRQMCRVLLVQIPQRYDAARTVRIIGEDGAPRTVQLNQPTREANQSRMFDVTVGRYDIVAGAGQSYQTKRQEAQETLPALMQAMPVVATVAPDLVMRSFDVPYGEQIADRTKRYIAQQLPGVLGPADHDEQEQDGQDSLPPQIKSQIQQMQQQLAQMGAALQSKEAELQVKRDDTAAKVLIARINALTQMLTTHAKLGADQEMFEAEQALEMATHMMDGMRDDEQREADAATASTEADNGRMHDMMMSLMQNRLASAQSAQGHAQSMEAQDAAHQQGLDMQTAGHQQASELEALRQAGALRQQQAAQDAKESPGGAPDGAEPSEEA